MKKTLVTYFIFVLALAVFANDSHSQTRDETRGESVPEIGTTAFQEPQRASKRTRCMTTGS